MFSIRKKSIKKVEKKTSKKFSLRTLVWFGFNYTCGMAFPLAFSTLIYGDTGKGVGLWVFLILVLGSVLAATMGYAYSKMAKVYIKSNGATYAYVRGGFGRFLGWIIGSLQYVTLPLATVGYILSMISLNFANLPHIKDWPHKFLWLDLIGLGVYLLAATSIFLGLKYFKFFINLSGVIKWTSAIFIIICAIALDGHDNFAGFSYAVTKTNEVTKHNFFTNFNDSFVTLFYFYAGFETYTTIAKNVKNPARTIPRAILWVTTLTLLFYVVVTITFIGVKPVINDQTGGQWFGKNPALEITQIAAGTLGTVFVIASMVSLKLNVAMQSSLYASGMVEPLAIEHYISPSFSKLNKDRISVRAAILNISLTTFLTTLLILLPGIITWNDPNATEVPYSDLLAFTTIIIFIQYILVLSSIFRLYMKKLILLRTIEKIGFSIVLIFLSFELVNYFYEQFNTIFTNLTNSETDDDIEGIFAVASIVIFFGLLVGACLLYKFHYLPIYERRMKNNPELQEKLDSAFKISGYAKLEMELYKRKNETIKELRNNKKIELAKLDANEIRNEKNIYKKEKNEYLNNLNEKLKNLKLEYKENVKKIKDLTHNISENKKMKNQYLEDAKLIKQNTSLSKKELNEKLKNLKLEYKENVKTIKHPKDDFEIINNLYNDYWKTKADLKDKKAEDLFYMKENALKYFAIKSAYIKSKHNLLYEIDSELEDYINNPNDE